MRLPLGPLQVTLTPINCSNRVVLGLSFLSNAEGSFKDFHQAAAGRAVDANRQAVGPYAIEYGILANGQKLLVGTIQAKTRSKYIEIAASCARALSGFARGAAHVHDVRLLVCCHKRAED